MAVEMYDFSRNYDSIESLLEISETDFGRDASEIITMDDAHFEISISDVTMDGFYLKPENSSEISIQERHPSAFSLYRKSQLNAATGSFVFCETLHKRCLRFLRKMNEDRKIEIQRFHRSTSPVYSKNKQELKEKKKDPAKSAFDHRIAERNRRVKMNEHFQNLYSLLPRNCKRDKHSILANTISYLKELKLRVWELEQQSESVDESIFQKNFSNSEEGNAGFESYDKPFNSERLFLYRSTDVVLERQCDDIPCQFKITINVQTKKGSCSATLLLRVIELLRAEKLEIMSVSHIKGSGFQATFAVFRKGEEWDISHWQTFGRLVSRTVKSAVGGRGG